MSTLSQSSKTIVIKPKSKWFDWNFREFLEYHDLLFLFVRRTFVIQHKQTILGPAWAIIQPLMTSAVFTIVFGLIAKLPTDGIPQFLFYMCGNILWGFFAGSLTLISNTFALNAGMYGKVYFPRLIIPVSVVFNNLITFGIQIAFFILMMLFYIFQPNSAVHPNLWILSTPLILLQVSLLSLGVGLIITSVTTKYRDLAMLINFGIQLWMYASPIAYSVSTIGPKWLGLFMLNPMAPAIATFRYALLGTGEIYPSYLALGWLTTLVLFFSGITMFNHFQKNFIDTI
jgi:lipopolysaccharide transport system permease protein